MYWKIATAYIIGAFTFWPLVGITVYLAFRYGRTIWPNACTEKSDESSDEATHAVSQKASKLRHFPLPQLARLNSNQRTADFDSDVEVSCWVRLAPTFIASSDPYEESDSQSSKYNKPPASTARGSLQKLMGTSFFSSFGGASSATKELNARGEDGVDGKGTTGSSTTSSVNVDAPRPKSVSKCPKYWAVVRGAQLQLFEDKSERKLMELISLPQFIVTLWPQNLQEYELFYRRYPIVLLSRLDSEGLVSLDLYPGIPPRDAIYLYISNPVEKEDLYFALIKESKHDLVDSDESVFNQKHNAYPMSLGPRDPVSMAKPIQVKKAESQQLQSTIWNSELPADTQWLNALLGRIFLALKDSKLADDYLRKKFVTKLKPISASSSIIGDIDVKTISSGSSAPSIYNVKLKELTPDGNLVLSAEISYTGGFKVILATSVKLAAVTSLTTVEIPIELAAKLRNLKGQIIIRVKPAPSERIWYAFESMPDVDLHIEPAVYDTHISLSVVTKFIKSKILDSLKEALVMPYMDDLTFYDTQNCFYRGGIWETPDREKEVKTQQQKKQKHQQHQQQQQQEQMNKSFAPLQNAAAQEYPSLPARSRQRSASGGSTAAKDPLHPSGKFGNTASPSSRPPSLRNRGSPDMDLDVDASINGTNGAAVSSSSSVSGVEVVPATTAVQRFSNWVKRKKNTTGPRSANSAMDFPIDSDAASTSPDAESILNMSPGSVRNRQRAPTTTYVTQANAPPDNPLPVAISPASNTTPTDPFSDSPASSAISNAFNVSDGEHDESLSGVTNRELPALPAEQDLAAKPLSDSLASTEKNSSPPSAFTLSPSSSQPPQELPLLPIQKQAVRRKPVPPKRTTERETTSVDKLDFPSNAFSRAQPSIETTNESISGELSEPLSRKSSFSSLHSRRLSHSNDAGSVRSSRSGHSSSGHVGPTLPPRHRRVVPLSNVAPERESTK